MNTAEEKNILYKINSAKEIINKYNYTDDGIINKLKDIMMQTEDAFNNVKITNIKSYAALIAVKEMENQLDNILIEVKKLYRIV